MRIECFRTNLVTLDSGINIPPGITVAPPLRNFYITILILFYINLGIAVIFLFFCLQKFSKINKRTPMFIPESRVGNFPFFQRFPQICKKFAEYEQKLLLFLTFRTIFVHNIFSPGLSLEFSSTLDSGINIGVRLLIFEKNWRKNKIINDRNA